MIDDIALQKKLKSDWFAGLYDKQQDILNAFLTKRDIRICAGVRSGKTLLCAYLCLRTILEGEKEKKSKNVWIVAPTYELAEKTFNYVARWKQNNFNKTFKVGQRPLKMRGKYTKLEIKSGTEPNQMLGEELDLVVMDECSRLQRRVWEEFIYQRLSSRKGKSVFISTPFGKNWFHDEWVKGKTADDAAVFHFDSKSNPYFPQEEWERARKNLPEQVFKQEYMALFLEDAASVFRGIDDIIHDNCLEDSKEGHYYVMGVDLGKHEDFTVITVLDRKYKKVVHFDRFRQIDYPLQKERITAAAKRYNNARIILDSTGVGQPIKDDLERQGLLIDDFVFSNKSKRELVEKLSIFIEQKHLIIPNNQILIDELKAFGYQLTEFGNVRYGAPQGYYDDCVSSLGLAVWGLTPGTPPPSMTIQGSSQVMFQEMLNKKETIKHKLVSQNRFLI